MREASGRRGARSERRLAGETPSSEWARRHFHRRHPQLGSRRLELLPPAVTRRFLPPTDFYLSRLSISPDFPLFPKNFHLLWRRRDAEDRPQVEVRERSGRACLYAAHALCAAAVFCAAPALCASPTDNHTTPARPGDICRTSCHECFSKIPS